MNRSSLLCLLLPCLSLIAADPEEQAAPGAGKRKDERYPDSHPASDSAEAALKKLSVAPGLQVDLWAAEPLLANPVALCFDERGRAFVAETYRRRTSVPDIRKFESWQPENFALRTVADRRHFLEAKFPIGAGRKPTKELADFNQDGAFDYTDWGIERERIKLLTDGTGSGKADRATVFATLPATPASGVQAGVAVLDGKVFTTCVPDLWSFDTSRDGEGVNGKALLTGFGVHVAYGGHDMHGPKFGPDGRLYWSLADCGARVETKEGAVLDCPDSGAIFRCELDGSNAELVAIGLRNPQSLAFNEAGDLFTGDNNADGGDKARWTHIVDGADYGWRIGWQFLKKSDTEPTLGAWNGEGMWQLDVGRTNPAVLPPVGLIGHGPAGVAYYPGSGLPEAYRDHFFMADFPGGVRAFQLTPHGASYTVENPGEILQNNAQKTMTGKLLWGLFPSDVQFGAEGGLYVLDWVEGWDKTGKGRIFRVHDPAVDAGELVQKTKALLAAGTHRLDEVQLGEMLSNPDQRVRFAAQRELVARSRQGSSPAAGMLVLAARMGEVTPDGRRAPTPSTDAEKHLYSLARVHAIWGLGELYRRNLLPAPRDGILLDALSSAHDEERAQAAHMLSVRPTVKVTDPAPALLELLDDPAPRVRFFVAQSLGKLGVRAAIPGLFKLLEKNAGEDAYLRHAAVVALTALADEATLLAHADDASAVVRSGVLLALRRKASPEIARFLRDRSPQLVLDAARAIHDGAIPGAWPPLAALAGADGLPEPAQKRAINANYLLGTAEAARHLGAIAAGTPRAEVTPLRLAALQALAAWNEPFFRDCITGLWRELPPGREAKSAVVVAAQLAPALLHDANDGIRRAAAAMAGALQAAAAEPALFDVATDSAAGGELRASALRALDGVSSARLAEAIKIALTSREKPLLQAARALAGKASPALAVEVNAAVLGKGSTREQQAALATIAATAVPEADQVLEQQLDALLTGRLRPALTLDLLEAAGQRQSPSVQQKLAAFEAARPSGDPLGKWLDCLEGGDAKAGRAIFAEKAEAACMRCHKVKGEGGDVGPDLAGIGQRQDRHYILQSIVDPNAVIAPGFENVVLTLKNGEMIAGLLNREDATELTLGSLVDGRKQQVKKSDVKERLSAPSVMPPGLADVLGKRALRDVVEYLATVK